MTHSGTFLGQGLLVLLLILLVWLQAAFFWVAMHFVNAWLHLVFSWLCHWLFTVRIFSGLRFGLRYGLCLLAVELWGLAHHQSRPMVQPMS